jgi:glucokinase
MMQTLPHSVQPRFGEAKGFDSFIMITLGTGVGGGIIFENKIYRGTTGKAGELGHVIIDYHGPLSNSNTRGGIEAYLGQRFLSRLCSRHHSPVYRKSVVPAVSHGLSISWSRLICITQPEEGNELAIQILRKTGEKLGYALVNYIHILDINKIIVSGGVAKAGEVYS